MIDTVDAKGLFRKIAQAAWECADPGMQYDDTINDWHTCPETGRITASNPCSEYLHLDNSSCNLASLNLMKFLEPDGGFEVEKFVRSVEFVITAMDISICFADFPTAEDRRDHPGVPAARHRVRQPRRAADGLRPAVRLRGRPLGRRRDHLADDRHGVPPLRRAGRHRRRVRRLRPQRRAAQAGHAQARRRQRRDQASGSVATAIVREATKQWTQGNKIGDKNGWRNAQASVLAPDRHHRLDDGL